MSLRLKQRHAIMHATKYIEIYDLDGDEELDKEDFK
jgi:hypothetical protein